METDVQQYSVEKRCLEIANKQALNENNRLLEQIISQDINNFVVNSSVDINDIVNVNVNAMEMCNRYLELEVELIKQHNMIEKGVNPSTSYSGSKPSGNTNNDRILLTPSSNEKNKVEVQSRKVKSSLTKRNFDSKNVCNEHVKNPVKDTKALCSICNECLFDANHAMCLIDHVNSMNVCAKSVSKKNKKKKRIETYRDMMVSSPICLLSKATKTKSWLWHRHLSYLNFDAINHLAKHDLIHGLPRLKFEKDHLCSTCAIGKNKKQSHKPKSEDTNQEKLYLLHMDLCGPMRIFIRYAPKKKVYRIYNRHTQKIIETIHIDFDELIAMASEQLSSGPGLQCMSPATPNSGLIPSPPPSVPFVPPSRHEWDLVFQPVFDEFLSPPASVASPVLVEEASAPVVLIGSAFSTTIDKDTPSPSTSQTTPQSQSQTIPLNSEEESHDLEQNRACLCIWSLVETGLEGSPIMFCNGWYFVHLLRCSEIEASECTIVEITSDDKDSLEIVSGIGMPKLGSLLICRPQDHATLLQN
nr:Gag-Pol polyprotein [Tanacetum cinerariifolium]